MSEQDAHMQRLFKVLELLSYPELAKRVQHISFGKVKGMSTRRGNVKYLDDILEECGTFMVCHIVSLKAYIMNPH